MSTAAAFPYAAPSSQHHHARHPSVRTTASSSRSTGDGRKHAERLLSSLAGAEHPAAAADRLARKFLAASSHAIALHTLSHVLSSSPSTSSAAHHLALPLYRRIRDAPWFRWNPKLAAAAAPFLHKLGSPAEVDALLTEAAFHLKPRELATFYGDLAEAYARYGSGEKVREVRSRLRELRPGKVAYGSVVRALCLLGSPGEAEEMVAEMASSGFKPSPFEYRSVVQSYGRLGQFAEMRRALGEMVAAGCEVDTVCVNMVISCYGDHGELPEMAEWLGKMRSSGVPFSIRTYNSVLNSCPGLCSMLQTPQALPLSVSELVGRLEEGGGARWEALLVRELVGSCVVAQMLQWSAEEGKLDLHGCHLGSALVVVLQWVEEVRGRFLSGGGEAEVVPVEVSLVCGVGKHSGAAGESPVKRLVREVMFRMGSPMRIDRKNGGRLVARGAAVRDWLRKMEGL